MAEKKKGPGRPPKYEALYSREISLLKALASLGKTEKEMAEILQMPRSAFQDLLKRSGISGTIKDAKKIADAKVVASLYLSATGYDYTEEHYDKDGNLQSYSKKHRAPDTGAQAIWLCNRDPEHWKSVSKVIYERPPGEIEKEAEAHSNAWADKVLKPFLSAQTELQNAARVQAEGDKKDGGG